MGIVVIIPSAFAAAMCSVQVALFLSGDFMALASNWWTTAGTGAGLLLMAMILMTIAIVRSCLLLRTVYLVDGSPEVLGLYRRFVVDLRDVVDLYWIQTPGSDLTPEAGIVANGPKLKNLEIRFIPRSRETLAFLKDAVSAAQGDSGASRNKAWSMPM